MSETAIMPDLWDDEERVAWAPPREITPSQWAAENREMAKGESDITGPWRNENAPYLVGIMDIPLRPGVIQANVMKAAQVGVSEAVRNIICFMADVDPDPVGLTLPDRAKGRKIVKRYVRPLFRRIPALRQLVGSAAHDTQLELVSLLNGFNLHLMWSGSASATSSDPLRMVFCDEVDKFEEWAGDEPDAVARTFKRLRSFGERGRQINVSTPTTTNGQIYELFQNSDVKLYYHVPCPHCGKFQRLVFPQLRWTKFSEAKDKNELAALIVQRSACWYECMQCGKRIDESQKPAAIRAGKWSGADGFVKDFQGKKFADAMDVQRWPTGTRLGFQISALTCLWETWPRIAAEFLRAEGSLAASFNFRTETLGEPFESQVSRLPANVFSDKSRRAVLPEGIVPAWGWTLIATIDTQADHFYVVIRAWGAAMKSARVWHGKVLTFQALDTLLFTKDWPLDPKAFGTDAPPLKVAFSLIDSGGTADESAPISRTMEVYGWTVPRQAIVRAIKGASRPGPALYWAMKDPIESASAQMSRRKMPAGLRAWLVDTHRCADLLDDAIKRGLSGIGQGANDAGSDPEIWLLNTRDDEEYNRHLAAEHRTVVRHGGQTVERWTPIHPGSRHDYRDCEKYQMAAAYMANVHLLPADEQLLELRRRQIEDFARQRTTRKDAGGNTSRKGREDPWQPRPL